MVKRRHAAKMVALFAYAAACVRLAAACGGDRSGSGSQGAASFDVGPAGGTFVANGVLVDVPTGAVAGPVTITVTADTSAPPGYTVDGKVYHFAPEGLTFAVPVSVTLPGQSTSELVYWTAAGSQTDYGPLTTTLDAKGANAQVTHFSSGFVGSSAASVICTSVRRVGLTCDTFTTIDAPSFGFEPLYVGGDPKGGLVCNDPGLTDLLDGVPLVMRGDPAHTSYGWSLFASSATATVNGNTLVSFSAHGARQGAGPTSCVNPPPLISVTCSGGGIAIGAPQPQPPTDATIPDAGPTDSGSDAVDAGGTDSGDDAGPTDSGSDAVDAGGTDAGDAADDAGDAALDCSGVVPQPQPGLVGYWRFEETAGQVCDWSGHGHHGYLRGTGYTRGVPGVVGLAMAFDGDGGTGAVVVPASADLDFSTGATMELFLRTDNVINNVVGTPFSRGTGNNDDNVLMDDNCGDVQLIFTRLATLSTTNVTSACNLLSLGTFAHVAFVNDGVTLSLYLNGNLVTSAAGGQMGPVASDLWIGLRESSNGGIFPLIGAVDELRWWTVVRTQAQICADAGRVWNGATCL
jgi:hypothetical protein